MGILCFWVAGCYKNATFSADMNILVVANGGEGRVLLDSLKKMDHQEVYHYSEGSSLFGLVQACATADVVFCFDYADYLLETLMFHNNNCSIISCYTKNENWNSRVLEYGEQTGARVSICTDTAVFSDKSRLMNLMSA